MQSVKNIQISIGLLLCIFLSSCYRTPYRSHKQRTPVITPIKVDENKEQIMTVFIHGTVLPRPSLTAFVHLFKKHTKKMGLLDRYQDVIRQTGYSKNQPIQSVGLHTLPHDSITHKDPLFACKITNNLYQEIDDLAYHQTRQHHFYTFGWSGRLDNSVRVHAAKELYDALVLEKAQLEKRAKKPVKIHINAHSHGGNVALNLGALENKHNLNIDTLILYGTPVQRETEALIKADIFEKIYHCYSRGDHTQVADFLSTKDAGSRRTFGTNKKNLVSLPKKLTQVCVQAPPNQPFHYELWLYAYAQPPHVLYRKRFSLYPLPVMIFTPMIIKMIKAAPDHGTHLTFSIATQPGKRIFSLHPLDNFSTHLGTNIINFANLKEKALEQLRNGQGN